MLRPRRISQGVRPEDVATVPLAPPSTPTPPEVLPETREGVVSERLWLTHTDQPTIPLVPSFAHQKCRRRPLLLVLSVVVLASLLLGAGTLVAQQHVGQNMHQQAGVAATPAGGTRAYTLPRIPTPTPVPAAPTATPLPPLPNFAVIPPFCNVDLDGNPLSTGTPTPTGCVDCPYTYDSTQYPYAEVEAALQQAAALYHLPPLLVEALAWEESGWQYTGVITCQYDTGVMQLKQGYWQWIDEFSDASCGLSYNTYDPLTLVGNADMGAKLIAFLYCYYGWLGDGGGTHAQPSQNTSDWYYQQAGLAWPDTLLGDGQPNPNSLCAAPLADSTLQSGSANAGAGPYVAGTYTWQQVFAQMPPGTPWSCPFSAIKSDHTLYELVVAAYNAGTGTIDSSGITNPWYVDAVSIHLVDLSQGQTPPEGVV